MTRTHIGMLGLVTSAFAGAAPFSAPARHVAIASLSTPAGHEWRIPGPGDSESLIDAHSGTVS
jgi:hypothetical protein